MTLSAQFFTWRAMLNRIATKQKLFIRGVQLGDTLCTLCGRKEETTSDILISCNISNVVWNMWYKWFGVSFVNQNDMINNFDHFSCMCCNKEGNRLWKYVWASIIWCIWKHRNSLVFNQDRINAVEILTMAQVQSWAWLKHKVNKANFSYWAWI